MDRIEKYFATHRDELDVLEPTPDSWEWLDRRLDGGRRPRRGLTLWISGVAAAILVVVAGWMLSPEPGDASTIAASSEALEVGDHFPELMLDNQFGEAVPLSTLQGKVVLVEFWASYSKVCTDRQCYYFKPIHEQYADHGFEIYGISVDTNMQSWLQAIESEGLPWVNVAEFGQGEAECGLQKKFLLEQLPTTYLLDQTGKIVAKDVGTHELEWHIERLLTAE